MGFCDDPNTDLYGTYADYNPGITRYKTNQELEEEIDQLKAKVDRLEKCITDLKYVMVNW